MLSALPILLVLSVGVQAPTLEPGQTCALTDKIRIFHKPNLKVAKKKLGAGVEAMVRQWQDNRYRVKTAHGTGWVDGIYFQKICRPVAKTPAALQARQTCELSGQIKVFHRKNLKVAMRRVRQGEAITIEKVAPDRYVIQTSQEKGWVLASQLDAICLPVQRDPEPEVQAAALPEPEPVLELGPVVDAATTQESSQEPPLASPVPAPDPVAVVDEPAVEIPPETAPAVQEPAPAPEVKRVLMMPVTVEGVDEALGAMATSSLSQVCGARSELEVVTTEDLAAMATNEQQKQVLGCEANVSCMAEVSEWAQTENVLKANLGRVGEMYAFTLSLVNSKRAQVAGRAQREFRNQEELPKVAEELVLELFGLEGRGNMISYRLTEGQDISLAILNMKTAGLSESVAANLTQVLSVELKRIDGASVISSDDIEAMLSVEADKEILGCDSDTACLAAIGGALGVDKLVVGQVGMLGTSYVISLKLISPLSASVDNRINETFRGDEATLIPAIRNTARRLLGIESKDPGSLSVAASQMGAVVVLNGQEKGELPMAAIADLLPGRHNLRVEKDGYIPWVGDVYVNPFDNTAHWVDLAEAPERWYQKWWVWTITGTVAAGVATTLALTLGGSDQIDTTMTVE